MTSSTTQKTPRILIVMALPQEGQGLFEARGIALAYCGIGKVNASYSTTKAIHQNRPDLVVNLGTAGSSKFRTHALVNCHSFVQRDMDLRGLGFELGHTPFDQIPGVIHSKNALPQLESGRCASGDSFQQGVCPVECDILDMEAYAIAKICKLERLPFLSLKYITDGADENAHHDWAANVALAAKEFVAAYDRILKVPATSWIAE